MSMIFSLYSVDPPVLLTATHIQCGGHFIVVALLFASVINVCGVHNGLYIFNCAL